MANNVLVMFSTGLAFIAGYGPTPSQAAVRAAEVDSTGPMDPTVDGDLLADPAPPRPPAADAGADVRRRSNSPSRCEKPASPVAEDDCND
jgi:hypothetical protein